MSRRYEFLLESVYSELALPVRQSRFRKSSAQNSGYARIKLRGIFVGLVVAVAIDDHLFQGRSCGHDGLLQPKVLQRRLLEGEEFCQFTLQHSVHSRGASERSPYVAWNMLTKATRLQRVVRANAHSEPRQATHKLFPLDFRFCARSSAQTRRSIVCPHSLRKHASLKSCYTTKTPSVSLLKSGTSTNCWHLYFAAYDCATKWSLRSCSAFRR